VYETERETADLSTTLRSLEFPVGLGGVGALHAAFLNESSTRGFVQRRVAGNPAPVEMTILFGYTNSHSQDVFVRKHFQEMSAELQIPPLRFAPVGMTKGEVTLPFRSDAADDEQQVPPLRFATVGMTLLLGKET
jgi:hypothetical protein